MWAEAALKMTVAWREAKMKEAVNVWAEAVRHGCWVLMVAGEEHCGSLQKGKR